MQDEVDMDFLAPEEPIERLVRMYSNGYFRAMARTLLDEVLGYREDWIVYQLTHAVKDPNTLSENPWLQSEADRNSLSFQIQRYL
jgi:hypothetical protein